jgi:hypothetical protein
LASEKQSTCASSPRIGRKSCAWPASIKAGTVAPSAILRRLTAYPRQNTLTKALKEIGRSERRLFTLDWISDTALRRRANAGLNNGEARKRPRPRCVLPSPRRNP